MHQEIDAFVKKHGHVPSFTDRAELPYCFSFQKECLRFRPPGFTGIPHKISKDSEYPRLPINQRSSNSKFFLSNSRIQRLSYSKRYPHYS